MAEQLTIPGAPGLALRIRRAAARDALGHAAILSGPGDLSAAARFFAAALECEEADRPCGVCGPCRKVLRDIHPDVVTAVDPEHKNLSMEVLRRLRSDAYILPNEGRRKVYIFPDCELLDPKTQNVLLKVLEEGPSHAAFLFCTHSSAALLPTIRSRCVEWRLAPDGGSEAAGASLPDVAVELCALLLAGRAPELAAFFAGLENRKCKREELLAILSGARDVFAGALAVCCGAESHLPLAGEVSRLGRRRLAEVISVFEEYMGQCQYNIGVGHVAGAIGIALTK